MPFPAHIRALGLVLTTFSYPDPPKPRGSLWGRCCAKKHKHTKTNKNMGMDVMIEGFRKATDPRWAAMKAVANSCDDAGVKWPDSVKAYFGKADPNCDGTSMDIEYAVIPHAHPEEGYPIWDIDLSKLPKDLKIVRVWLSY